MKGVELWKIVIPMVLAALLLGACSQATPASPTTKPPAPAPATTVPPSTQAQPPTTAASPKPTTSASTPTTVAAKLPQMVVATSFGMGSDAYINLLTLLRTFEKYTGVKGRQIPADTDVARLRPVLTGDADISIMGGPALWLAGRAMFEWASVEPQPISTLFWPVTRSVGVEPLVSERHKEKAKVEPLGLATRKDYNITDIKQLKGKRIAYFPVPYQMMIVEGYLATAGLTWDDVKKVNVSGYVGGVQALAAGSCDAAFASGITPEVKELDAARGLQWFNLNWDDPAVWSKYLTAAPFALKSVGNYGAGVPEGKTVNAVIYWPNPIIGRTDTVSDDLAYMFLKTIQEHQDDWKNTSSNIFWWYATDLDIRMKDFVDNALVPVHPGAVKYLKEQGSWTAEAQKKQDALLADQKAWIAAYKAQGKDYWTKNYGTYKAGIVQEMNKEIK